MRDLLEALGKVADRRDDVTAVGCHKRVFNRRVIDRVDRIFTLSCVKELVRKAGVSAADEVDAGPRVNTVKGGGYNPPPAPLWGGAERARSYILCPSTTPNLHLEVLIRISTPANLQK